MTTPAQGKIAFANQLRGLAVLLVIASHYALAYWTERDLVAQYIFAPPATGAMPASQRWLSIPTLSLGPLGVALFFLVSGFVIPFSLHKLGRARFVIARLLRIFPTYWAASAVSLLAVWLSSLHWGLAFHVDPAQLLANLLLVQGQTGHLTTDLVNWTLAVELKFYLVAMLLWPLLRRWPTWTIAAFAVLLYIALRSVPKGWNVVPIGHWQLFVAGMSADLMFLPFMLIGTLFHFAFVRRIPARALVVSAIVVMYVFLETWKKTPRFEQHASAVSNYSYALLIFAAAYLLRDRFRPRRLLDFFADISYPLYVLHSLVGYVAIRWLMAHGAGSVAATLLALALAIGLAWAIHRTVELPTAALGRHLGGAPRSPLTWARR